MSKDIFSKECQTANGGGEYKIGKWNSILYRHSQTYLSKKLEPYNIGGGQVVYLIHLYFKDGVSQEELADHLKIDKATVAKALKKLEDNGYVTRLVDAEDKRAYKVHTTDKAKGIRASLMSDMERWETAILKGFSDEEKKMAAVLLERMAKNAIQIQV